MPFDMHIHSNQVDVPLIYRNPLVKAVLAWGAGFTFEGDVAAFYMAALLGEGYSFIRPYKASVQTAYAAIRSIFGLLILPVWGKWNSNCIPAHNSGLITLPVPDYISNTPLANFQS